MKFTTEPEENFIIEVQTDGNFIIEIQLKRTSSPRYSQRKLLYRGIDCKNIITELQPEENFIPEVQTEKQFITELQIVRNIHTNLRAEENIITELWIQVITVLYTGKTFIKWEELHSQAVDCGRSLCYSTEKTSILSYILEKTSSVS